MPSSIAAMTLAAAMPLILFGLRRGTHLGRLLAAALVGATLVTGVSMAYLGAHWLSDVLVGWLLGALIGAGALRLLDPPGRRRLRAAA